MSDEAAASEGTLQICARGKAKHVAIVGGISCFVANRSRLETNIRFDSAERQPGGTLEAQVEPPLAEVPREDGRLVAAGSRLRMNGERRSTVSSTSQGQAPAIDRSGLRLQREATHSKRVGVITAELLRGNAVLHERGLHLIACVAVVAIGRDTRAGAARPAESDFSKAFE